jgi:hypothetical protein
MGKKNWGSFLDFLGFFLVEIRLILVIFGKNSQFFFWNKIGGKKAPWLQLGI